MTHPISDKKSTKLWLALPLASVLVLSLATLLPLNNRAFAMGPGPGGCAGFPGTDGGPEYHSKITSLIIDNGVERFDVLANPGMTIPVQKYGSYTADVVFHTDYGYRYENGQFVNETNSDLTGYLWFYTTAYGFGSQSDCVGPVKGNQDIAISRTYGMSYYGEREGPHYVVFDTDIYDPPEAEYYVHLLDELPGSSGPVTNELTVNTEDRNGNAIYGYYSVLYDNKDGSVVDTGFSPATFTLVSGKAYIIQVQDYGNYVFDEWEGQGSFSERDRYISITSDTSITAVYRNVNESPTPPDEDGYTAPAGQSVITVRTINSGSNNEISGYYTILYDDNGSVLETGFSPVTFDVTSGQTYTVEVQDYGSYYFNYWQDNHDADRSKTITAADGGKTLTAVYSTSPSATPPPENEEEEEQPPQQTLGKISVITLDSSGNQIYGYYTTLSQNGNIIQTAFSPAEFTVNNGETYQVAVGDYGQYVFDHWSDGSFDRFHNVQAGDGLTAVYRP